MYVTQNSDFYLAKAAIAELNMLKFNKGDTRYIYWKTEATLYFTIALHKEEEHT